MERKSGKLVASYQCWTSGDQLLVTYDAAGRLVEKRLCFERSGLLRQFDRLLQMCWPF
jgi:hypothetical protein